MVISSTEKVIEFFKDTSGEYLSIYEVKIPNAGTFDVYYTMKGGQKLHLWNLIRKILSLMINI